MYRIYKAAYGFSSTLYSVYMFGSVRIPMKIAFVHRNYCTRLYEMPESRNERGLRDNLSVSRYWLDGSTRASVLPPNYSVRCAAMRALAALPR